MEEQNTSPRRKKKSQLQIFKETYLPLAIAGVAVVLIIVFIIGSIVRAVQQNRYETKMNKEAEIAASQLLQEQTQEANEMITQVKEMALHSDYAGAIALIDGFSGELSKFPELENLYKEYLSAQSKTVKWTDTNNILALSFQMLIADPDRAFADEKYGNSYNNNFVTTEEFTKILHGLYENNYILVSLKDIYSNGQEQVLYLPEGKKPVVLIETQVNYNTYMVDSDGDKLPDQGGDGFASKLVIDANGNITCQMVDSSGQTVEGAFDLVPILDSFVTTHPDFSYKGAKAVLALTGYDGLFGYRTNPSAKGVFNTDAEAASAKEIAKKLQDTGYELACYTYENAAYGQMDNAKIQNDLNKWLNEVTPILGDVENFVFAKNSDISDDTAPYSGDKIDSLLNAGFTRFLGFCTEATCWYTEGSGYMRLGRTPVTGSEMKKHPEWFEDFFSVSAVWDSKRP